MRLVSLEMPEPGATRCQDLMRQNRKLTRRDATRSTPRPKCPQSQPKKSKQGSAFVEFTETPFPGTTGTTCPRCGRIVHVECWDHCPAYGESGAKNRNGSTGAVAQLGVHLDKREAAVDNQVLCIHEAAVVRCKKQDSLRDLPGSSVLPDGVFETDCALVGAHGTDVEVCICLRPAACAAGSARR
jgi:hypothetical protein